MTVYSPKSLEAHPPYLHAPYKSTPLRSPRQPLMVVPQTLSERSGPVSGAESVRPGDADMTRQHTAEPLGR